MAIIRGRIFLDREVVPEESIVGGEWPFIQCKKTNKWYDKKTREECIVLTLEELLDKTRSNCIHCDNKKK